MVCIFSLTPVAQIKDQNLKNLLSKKYSQFNITDFYEAINYSSLDQKINGDLKCILTILSQIKVIEIVSWLKMAPKKYLRN